MKKHYPLWCRIRPLTSKLHLAPKPGIGLSNTNVFFLSPALAFYLIITLFSFRAGEIDGLTAKQRKLRRALQAEAIVNPANKALQEINYQRTEGTETFQTCEELTLTQNDIPSSLAIDPFDADLGTLKSVEINTTGTLKADIAAGPRENPHLEFNLSSKLIYQLPGGEEYSFKPDIDYQKIYESEAEMKAGFQEHVESSQEDQAVFQENLDPFLETQPLTITLKAKDLAAFDSERLSVHTTLGVRVCVNYIYEPSENE